MNRKFSVRTAMGLMVIGLLLAPGLVSASNLGFYIGTGMGLPIPNMSGDDIDWLEPEGVLHMELIHLGYNFTENLGVSWQWGAAAGDVSNDAEFRFGNDTTWGQGYMDLSFRYSMPLSEQWTPYLEAGVGNYTFMIMGDDGDFTSDPVLGYRLALGANYYIGNFYLAPEFSYHFTNYSEGELDTDVYGEENIDFENTGDMGVLMLKIGYHFRQD